MKILNMDSKEGRAMIPCSCSPDPASITLTHGPCTTYRPCDLCGEKSLAPWSDEFKCDHCGQEYEGEYLEIKLTKQQKQFLKDLNLANMRKK